MPLSSLAQKLLRSLFCCLFVLSVVLLPRDSCAIYEGVRDMTYDSDTFMCRGNDYETHKDKVGSTVSNFDPFMINKRTSEFETNNTTCIAVMTTVGAILAVTETVLQYNPKTCGATNYIGAPKLAAEQIAAGTLPPPLPYTTPATPAKVAFSTYRCAQRTSEFATITGQCASATAALPEDVVYQAYICGESGMAGADMGGCCAGVSAYNTALSNYIIAEAIIWDKARATFKNARLCGHSWNQWQDEDASNGCGKDGIYGKTEGPYKRCLKQLFTDQTAYKCGSSGQYNCADILAKDGPHPEKSNVDLGKAAAVSLGNQFYREYIYGGVEYEDAGSDTCENPWGSDTSLREKYLGYRSDKQRYYMTGSGGGASVFACHRFLAGALNEDTQRAYDCCKGRSQNTICIENRPGLTDTLGDYEYRFCKAGSKCNIGDTVFEAYLSQTKASYICAKTYSLCPYNHLLGGGTEIDDTKLNDDPMLGTTSDNYCQYLNHCSKLPILPYVYSSNLTGAYISGACRNLKGDSQNVYGYTAQLVPINTKNFSAPMAQCFKETMQNLFLNRAGATICEDPKEKPDINGGCSSGYIYKQGDALIGKSFFVTIQERLKSAIQIGLVISIMVFGYTILMGVPKVDTFNKKALFSYVVKIAIVMYFAVGTGWQDKFMEGVINFSGFMTDLTFKLDESKDDSKLDGCQFPRFNYTDSNEATRYNNPAYPPGLGYLRIWDVLDCKLARALGYGPEASVPNLIFMILGGFLDYGAGIIFVVGSLFMAFVMIMITVRSLHIFLMSTTAVILLIYVSPITITCAMFNRTKGVFSGWWKQILGLSLQPMILFAYLGVFITVFDSAIIGNVSFSGDGKTAPKKIICNNSSGTDVLFKNAFTKSNNTGEEDSIYCIFRMADIKTFHGFELLGVGLPVLESITPAKLSTITKAALLMFIFLQFLDKISKFAQELVGGATLSSNIAGAAKMAGKVMGGLQAIQKRGMGAAKKLGKFALRKGGEAGGMAKGAIRSLGKGGGGSSGEGGGSGDIGADKSSSSTGSGAVGADQSSSSAAADKSANGAQGDKNGKASKAPGLETIEEGDEDAEEGDDSAADAEGQARPD